jgi:RsiW-degrading membrane proteinase PrsW (M82 family)
MKHQKLENAKKQKQKTKYQMFNFFSGFSSPVIVVALGFALIPSLFWGVFYWGKSEVPLKNALISLVAGMFSVLPVLLLDHFFEIHGAIRSLTIGATLTATATALWVGLTEEVSKSISARIGNGESEAFNQVIDGMTYCVYAALGFALIENIKFFIIGFDRYGFISMPFAILFIFRLLGSTLAHTLFTGIYGYYFGKARFCRFNKKHANYTKRHSFFKGGLKLRWARLKHMLGIEKFSHDFRLHVRQDEILAEGLIIAVIIHALFDFALTMHHTVFVVPMLFIEYTVIAHEFSRRQNREVYVSPGKAHDEHHKKLYNEGLKIDNDHIHNHKHIGKHSF